MNKVSAHKVGLVLGGMFAIFHVVWAFLVFAGLAKSFLDWILGLHFLNFQYSINSFVLLDALILVIVTGVIGYIMGNICGWLWNLAHRAAHSR